MKHLRLIWRNATRNRVRAVLTAGGSAFLIFVVVFVLTALTAIDAWEGEADGRLRVAVQHTAGIQVPLSASLERFLRSDDVQRHGRHAQKIIFFAGWYRDPANFFTNIAADLDGFQEVWEEVVIPADVFARLAAKKNGAVAGESLARRFGWKVGQRIQLEGSPFGVVPDLELVGFHRSHDRRHEELLAFRWDYADELLGHPGLVSYYWVKARTPADIPILKQVIDGHTRNSPDPTETVTEKEFIHRFLEMMGNVQALVVTIAGLAMFILTLMTANAMAMSVRERVTEIAVLRALGFTQGHVLAFVVGESMLLTTAGAGLAVGASLVAFNALGLSPAPQFFPLFGVTGGTVAVALGAAAACGLFSAAVPAARSARRTIVDGLRQVV